MTALPAVRRDGVPATGYTRRLASFAADLRYEDLPPDVVAHVKLCLLDTLGCGLYGSTLPWSRILLGTVGAFGQPGPATAWGSGQPLSAPDAALVNGTAVHGLELDDLHKHSIVHPGSVVLPAALALAEHAAAHGTTVEGRRLLTAVVAGYEVAARVGMSVGTAHLVHGWHPTGTHGTLGAAAAAGAILGLDPDRMVHAFGIAGSQASGLMAAQYAAMVKRFHAGRAAQSGVYGAVLASRGFTGITDLFESEYGGYCTTFSPSHDLTKLVAGLGEVWETGAVGFKPYASNGSCHTAIDALLELRRTHGLSAEEVRRVTAYTSTATAKHVGWRYRPDSVTTAQMNLPYIVAVTLTDGAAFVEQFSEERVHDPRLVALAQRVDVVVDPDIDARGDKARHSVRIVVTRTDGTVLEASREYAKGSAFDPLTPAEVDAKFDRLAGRVLGPDRADRIRTLIAGLDDREDVRDLVHALAAAGPGSGPARTPTRGQFEEAR
jgi:aconitate decarboxylase